MIVAIIVGVVIFLIVFAIAAGTLGRETHRLAESPPAPSFELVDAVDFIADRLPEEVSAVVSYADVRDLVSWHLELLQKAGLEQKVGGTDELLIEVGSSGETAMASNCWETRPSRIFTCSAEVVVAGPVWV